MINVLELFSSRQLKIIFNNKLRDRKICYSDYSSYLNFIRYLIIIDQKLMNKVVLD